MTNAFDTNIAESQYVFDEAALKLSEKFFKVEDTSLLKVGTFGYLTALNSHAMRDSTFHRNMLYNEFFLTNSNLNSTLYNWAKMLDYNIELAHPSQVPILIKLNLDRIQDIASVSTINGNLLEYTIKRDTQFDIGGYPFLLPYDLKINIIKNRNTGQFTVSALYDFLNYNIKPLTIKTPYLKTTLMSEHGVTYIGIAATIFQIKLNEYIFSIQSNDILDVGIIEQNYGGNMVSFKAYYNDNSSNTSYYAPLETVFNEIDRPKTDKWMYYTYVGDDILRVYFSNRPSDFRPSFNSKIKIEAFTTSAENGNFNYTGNVIIRDPNLEKVNYGCYILNNGPTGGSSNKSFKETKIALMQQLRTRNGITTSYDLQTYFDKIKKETMDTRSDFKVVKLRDDIIRRQFSMFILSRNKNNDVIPTNTISLELSLDEISELNYSLKSGTLILYDRTENRYRLLRDTEIPEVYLNSTDSYLYSIPFLVNINFNEFPKSNIYFTNYTKSVQLGYEYLNLNTPYEILINSYTINRNPFYDLDSFTLSVFINTNLVNISNILIRACLVKDGEYLGYVDLQKRENTSEYFALINASDEFDKDGRYIIRNTFRDIHDDTLIPGIFLDGEYHIELGVMLREVNNNQVKSGIYRQMNGLNDYNLISILNSEVPISFAEDITDIMYCQVNYDQTVGKVRIKHVPVVGTLAYLNQVQHNEVMTDILHTIEVAKVASVNLENNTSIDVKFFNTYGKSKYFDIDTIDIRIKMVISLNVYSNRVLENSIKEFIMEYVESCNATLEKRFSFSNLIRLLETNFSEIKFIKFFTINGGNVQSIRQINITDESIEALPYDYIPEFLNVRKNSPVGDNEKWFSSAIDIIYES